ncbi:hypothetical protein HPB49_021226 [Dermacentor silvarum]|uniref:Uncharacterized protein n=1 Tax=Dermacentor silvarum TaxID=543639 RepID=A0ACB8CMV4_DERSI|nr:hypothetical protein HPB49_021226 [Dermacentor silvarum]
MSESISSLVLSDIQAACSTLGGWDEGKYYKEPDCIESLKDLLRYLRRDDESHEIRRILGRIQVLKTDLLPLLKFYPDDDSLFDVIIRLLVDLMNPAILLYKEELPVEKFARNNYLEIVSHLQSYKLAFTDSKVWIAITKKLESLLHKNWETRQEEDKDMIERILVLVRNILHVPANPSEEKRTDDDVNVHDQVLWAMHLAHMEDLLLYVTSSDDETDYCFHCLEILSLMLREQSFLQRKKALSHDEGYYFWALKFFMEFNRHNGFDVSLVSETICKEAFHYVQTQLEQYYEMMVTDKGKIRIWSKSSYLRDLVEMVHVYVKMLQHFAKGHRHIIVKQKTKARRKSKKKKPKENTPSSAVSEEVRQQEWLEVSSAISMALQGEEELPDDIVPYDSTLDNTENEQKLDALSRIHAALKARETAKAVALLRAGQELWPGQDMFGSQEDGTEFQALKEIFFANMAGETRPTSLLVSS